MRTCVLDTRVLVTGFLRPESPSGMILNEVVNLSLFLILDSRIFFEYQGVLSRPRFDLPLSLTEPVLALIRARGNLISPSRFEEDLPDEGVRPFVEVALSTGAPWVFDNMGQTFEIPSLRVISPGEALHWE